MYTIDVYIVVACTIFCVSGILIHNFKMYWFISGYNTMPEEEKKKYNIKKYTKVMRNVFFIASLLILSGAFIFQRLGISEYCTPIYFMTITIGMVIFLIVYGQSKKIKSPKE